MAKMVFNSVSLILVLTTKWKVRTYDLLNIQCHPQFPFPILSSIHVLGWSTSHGNSHSQHNSIIFHNTTKFLSRNYIISHLHVLMFVFSDAYATLINLHLALHLACLLVMQPNIKAFIVSTSPPQNSYISSCCL